MGQTFHIFPRNETQCLTFKALYALSNVVTIPKKYELDLAQPDPRQLIQVAAPVRGFLLEFADRALPQGLPRLEVPPGKYPQAGIGNGRKIVAMLEKSRAIAAQQNDSDDLF